MPDFTKAFIVMGIFILLAGVLLGVVTTCGCQYINSHIQIQVIAK
jgi:hypothetical protein